VTSLEDDDPWTYGTKCTGRDVARQPFDSPTSVRLAQGRAARIDV
jgi:hypothetical protein